MKLNYFTTQTLPKYSHGGATRKNPIIVFGKNGAIRLNHPAVELMNLKHEDKISICQDEEKPENWYVFLDKANGYEARLQSDKKSLAFNHSQLVKIFVEAMGLEDGKTYQFPIAQTPTTVNGDKTKFYGILFNA